MIYIRQNTPFVLVWEIELQGTAIKLADTKVSVIASCARGRVDLTDYIDSIEENTITIKQNKGLAFIGDYSLMAIIESENLTTLKVQEKYVFRAIAKIDPTETESLISISSSIVASGGYDSALSEVSQNAIQNAPVAKEFVKVREELASATHQAIDEVLGGVSETYDTLKEIEEYIERDEAGAVALAESITRLAKEKVSKEDVDSALSTESENPVMNKVITEELNKKATNEALDALSDSVASLESKKADKDGVYSGMTVGRSIDLLGVEDVEEGSFLFRPTDGDGSIKDGVAVVKSVKGNSVVWNNYFDIENFSVEGGTMSRDGNKIVVTATGEYPRIIGYSSQLGKLPKGNVVLITFNADKMLRINFPSSAILGQGYANGYEWQLFVVDEYSFFTIYHDAESYTVGNIRIIDLTKMFQAGNEPTTIEDFYARVATLCIEDMDAYNAGEVVNMKASAIKSVGFNAWDEQWEKGDINLNTGEKYDSVHYIRTKNPIKVLPNQTYYVKTIKASGRILFYDRDMAYIGKSDAFGTQLLITMPNDCHYIMYRWETTTYNNDICINLSHTGYRNGEYEPYVEDVLALPTLDLFPNGMNKIGDVYDEYDEEKSVQRIGIRPYQSGDESIENVLTDGTSTLYVLEEPIVTPHDYRLAYKAWDFGTEQVMTEGNTTAITAGITYEFNARDTIRGNKAKNEEQDERMRILEGEVVRKGDYSPENKVGTADDLAGRGESVPASFGFRASGGKSIKDGRAYIKRIKGNSVVWNQKVEGLNAQSLFGMTFTWDASKNIITINGTSTTSNIIMCIKAKSEVGHIFYALAQEVQGTYTKTGTAELALSNGYGKAVYIKQASEGIYRPGNSEARTTIGFFCNVGDIFDNYQIKIQYIDLTQMFQAGNEPTTIEEYNARVATLGVDLNAYNEGEVIHCNTESIKSVGDNAWDEQWELGDISATTGANGYATTRIRSIGYTKVIPNETYYSISPSSLGLRFYDENKSFVASKVINPNSTFEVPSNVHYLRFIANAVTTYNNDICIRLAHTGYKTDYEPYWQDTLPLPIIRKYFPDGMKSAGTAHDEIRYNKASGKWEYSKGKMKEVDMGDMAWSYDSANQVFTSYTITDLMTHPAEVSERNKGLLCSKYSPSSTYVAATMDDKSWLRIPKSVTIKDTSYTDAATFKADMAGVMLYYEAAEWEWVELDAEDQNFRDYYNVADFGTEQSQSEVPSAAFSADIIYQFNAVDMIREHELEITEMQNVIATMQAQLASLINGGQ